MAHFARIDDDGTVREVIVIDNTYLRPNPKADEDEGTGLAFIAAIGLAGRWMQTSYSGSFRGRFAGIGMRYDAELDEFVDANPTSPDDAPEEPTP